ncbi:BA14K family protein [Phyllobacterium brassicacearum]|uniref:BA14K family protein n=1 Tax=Phyllobacterium brassicacearum TaxID=314235 RepID=UPI0010E5C96E|nr:BA14K family protein [Phyllobacterium brassicacearum]TDQ35041.1 BA14K-like protein [Phyllobacterium brassicacearum]
MKALKIIIATLGLLVTTQLAGVSAQEIQMYRPAPRGLDAIPIKPLILRNNSPANPASPDCTGTSRCKDFRVRRPIGPSGLPQTGRTQTERCQARYQSYRAFDNTYQPLNGPRRRCLL